MIRICQKCGIEFDRPHPSHKYTYCSLKCAYAARPPRSKFCKCGNPRRKGGQDCTPCHNANNTKNRKRWDDFTPEEKEKLKARAHASMALKRGQIHRKPCEVCGSPKSQMHHPDYSKHLEVVWLCRPHHMEVHRGQT